MKNSLTIVLLGFTITLCFIQTLYHKAEFDNINNKLDSIIQIQTHIYQVDSSYLVATRKHMSKCAFILRDGILADFDN